MGGRRSETDVDNCSPTRDGERGGGRSGEEIKRGEGWQPPPGLKVRRISVRSRWRRPFQSQVREVVAVGVRERAGRPAGAACRLAVALGAAFGVDGGGTMSVSGPGGVSTQDVNEGRGEGLRVDIGRLARGSPFTVRGTGGKVVDFVWWSYFTVPTRVAGRGCCPSPGSPTGLRPIVSICLISFHSYYCRNLLLFTQTSGIVDCVIHCIG